ncbi:MAG: aldose 1-epimerase family protein [Planctomycetia bacterium]|nr:aldose 1-epimerase family protein [Planctomycetia bacterium]
MPNHSPALDLRTLTDVGRDLFVESCLLGPHDFAANAEQANSMPFSIGKRVLRGGLREGVDVVEIDNGRLRLTIVPTRGMGIHQAECGGVRLGWQSPVHGPVNPRNVPVDEASGIGWLSGFDEFLVRCGLEWCGAPEWDPAGKLVHPLHGRIANLPVHRLEVGFDSATSEIVVIGTVDEARLFSNKLRLTSTLRTKLGSAEFSIRDEITNISTLAGELQLLYHINQGTPLVGEGATFHAPVKTLIPKDAHAAHELAAWQTYPAPRHGPESVFFFELLAGDDGWTQTMLSSPTGEQGLAVGFDRTQFPLFTLWKNPLPTADGYVTGLEPCINLPNTKSFEKSQGRVATLLPGEIRRFDLRLEVLTSAGEVARTREKIDALQRQAVPTIHGEPQIGWSPLSF